MIAYSDKRGWDNAKTAVDEFVKCSESFRDVKIVI